MKKDIFKNKELFLEIHIIVNSNCDANYDFKVYKTNPCGNEGKIELNEEENLWLSGFVKWDECINFEFNQDGCMLHSCGLFSSFIEDLKWVEKILDPYTNLY